ncbi:Phage tail sheath family protein [Kosakonia sp. BK9b]
MSIETIVPGVYIEEDATPAISVSQGATAVPLFIGAFAALEDKYKGKIVRISGWLDFVQMFTASSAGYSASVTITSTESTAPEEPDDGSSEEPDDGSSEEPDDGSSGTGSTTTDTNATAAAVTYTYTPGVPSVTEATATLALQLYFQNGGNPCYVFALEDTTDTAVLASIATQMAEYDDITILAVLDGESTYRDEIYRVLAGALDQSKGYFLIADGESAAAPDAVKGFDHAAVYYPELSVKAGKISDSDVKITGYQDAVSTNVATLADLKKVNPDLAAQVSSSLSKNVPALTVPASGAIAGVYCKTDRERGVWKAPANVVLSGVTDVSVRVSDDAQGPMNEAGINVLRYFSDRGVVVWGARTQQNDDNWRYISVRRLFDSAERDVKKAMRPMVFEPNNQPTWTRVWAAIDTYLYGLWQKGGLAGNSAEEAYFVRIGKGVTMTEEDINQGKMIVQIGMAAVRPAEFIILQFTQNMAQ